MAQSFFNTAEKLNKEHRRSKRWHKAITVMAAVVVFCTTYALILPALTWERSLVCETKEHTHTEACYAEVEVGPESKTLTCTKKEHTHGDKCYEEVVSYVCGLEEGTDHQHTDDCMKVDRVLVCTKDEHEHGDKCYHTEKAKTERQLVCSKPEHVHTDACFDAPPSYDEGYYCGHIAHKHNEYCYYDDGKLRCTISEHAHGLKCKAKPDADTETAKDWEATFADVKLSGDRAKDVLAIAQTQVGYTESSRNFVVDNEKTGEVRGYSRYGDWYGNPYGDWCAMFCAFCLDHANIKNIPVDANCQTWIEKLEQEGLYHKVGTYNPKPGDLVFYCWDNEITEEERCGDHVGFVYEVVDATEATKDAEAIPAHLRTIEGNWGDSVCLLDRELSSGNIIGYSELPKQFNTTFDGDDFTITAKYDADAKIPENAKLCAKKIDSDSALYKQYYQVSVDAMLANGNATNEDDLAISYLQLYDIGFYVNGKEIEPEGPVNISIATKEQIELQSDEVASAIHFGEGGTEVLHVQADDQTTEDASSVFSFTQDSFSVTAVVVSGTNYEPATELKNQDQVIVATWRGGTTYYLTDTVYNNGLLLTTEINNAKVWTVEYVDGIARLKNGTNSYVTVQNNQSGIGNSYRGNLRYTSNGDYWEIYTNSPDSYLNQYGGRSSTRAAGYTAPGASDDGSKWGILKQVVPGSIDTAPPVGSVTGVQTDRLTVGEWYILFGNEGNKAQALNAANINSSEALSRVSTSGGTVTYTGAADIVWQWTGEGFRNRNGEFLRLGADNAYWLGDSEDGAEYNGTYHPTYHILYNKQESDELLYNKVYMSATDNFVQGVSEEAVGRVQKNDALPLYLAQVSGNASITSGHENHPRTSTTDTPDMRDLVFYNFDTTTGEAHGLADVEYTIYDSHGDVVGKYLTTNDYAVPVGRLISGETYTIKQTAVPEGYVLVSQEQQFTVSNTGTALIGAFYDYNTNDYAPDKTAQVVDYFNRTYQVDLKAKQNLYDYVIESTNFSMVVDQSNSMLFPSDLIDTGKTITLYASGNNVGSNGSRLNALDLDKRQTYYIVTDEETTSTVYAIFYDGTGWVYQDASYYAKAQNRADGCEHNIMDGTSIPKFASSGAGYNSGANEDANGYIVHGGDVNYALNMANFRSGSQSFKLYTGSTYNRLHDLQQAMAAMCNALSSMTPNATIRLVTFDRAVENCRTFELGADGSAVTDVISAVNGIECAGGTRQDYAFHHLIGYNDSNNTGHTTNHLNTGENEYVVLITDGAPNGGDMNSVVNAANDLKRNNNKTTVVTAGLSMANVRGGSNMLKNAATDSSWSYAAETAGALSDYMTQILFRIANKQNRNYKTEVSDEISNSFYPINPANNEALTDGTIIDLQGNILTTAPANGQYGTVKYNSESDTWYVKWNSQTLNYGETWNGRIYLKAKEDFIGGNSIDTNKAANVSLVDIRSNAVVASNNLASPTVNVRLLPMNEVSSEETVFLGDNVSVQDKVKALYDQLEFSKLEDNGDDVHNKNNASGTSGLETDTFTLAYAWGNDLTDSDWDKLFSGEELTIPYTYDNKSSHGSVGYFTVKLVKSGEHSSFDEHTTADTGNAVETYTLKVVYTPYKIGESDGTNKRLPNAHNGTAGPGAEVTEPKTYSNPHKVNVVNGKITVVKSLTDELKSAYAQTFTFKILRKDGDAFVDTGDTVKVTVGPNATEGSAVATDLPRGTYKVEEQIDSKARYLLKDMEALIGDSDTNCTTEEKSGNWTFTIGDDVDGNDLIHYEEATGYHEVYSNLRDGYSGIEGVSYGTIKVTNDKDPNAPEEPNTKPLTVTKKWAAGSSDIPSSITVRLLQNNQPYGDPVTLTSNMNWKYTWSNLPCSNGRGTEYVYRVIEYPVPAGYTSEGKWTNSEGDELGYELTNTPIPEDNLTSLEVTKNWDDTANHPEVTLRLMADGEDTGRTITLPINGSWTGTFDGLARKNDAGAQIAYSVVEDTVTGYSPVYSNVTSETKMIIPEAVPSPYAWSEVADDRLIADMAKAQNYIDGLTINNANNNPTSVVSTNGKYFTWDNEKRETSKSFLFEWSYYNGVVFEGIEYMYDATENPAYNTYVSNYLAAMINGNTTTWKRDSAGKESAGYSSTYGVDCYKTASLLLDYGYTNMAAKLYADLKAQENARPNTDIGGNFFHTWESTPTYKVWLDGLYMAQPFMAQYAAYTNDTAELDKIAQRFAWVGQNMFDNSTGLYYHAANSASDHATAHWLRAIGWYAAALVDVMPYVNNADMQNQLQRLVDGMLPYQDANGMWHNYVTEVNDTNYSRAETSGTALMAYAILKGVNNGWLDEDYAQYAIKAFEGISETELDNNGLKDICIKGSPSNTVGTNGNASNKWSSGANADGKGVGPFIMAYSELLDYKNIQDVPPPDPDPVPGPQYYATTVTNSKVDVISVHVTKEWADGNSAHAADQVVVHLYADGEDTGKTLTLNAENNWSGEFTNLNDKSYDDNGNPHTIAYTVEEDFIEGYNAQIDLTQDDQGDYIAHIVNTPELYEMPETGGSGLIPIYALGALLLTAASMCGYLLRRKAERRSRD